MADLFTHGYALLIGVGDCADPTLSLPVTVKDIQALRSVLVNPTLCAYPDNHQQIRLLQDQHATKAAMLDGLVWLREQATMDPDATVIVYYSGHGWFDQLHDRYYLIPHDFDPYDWQTTALSADDFSQALQQIPTKRLLVILDCCHAAGMTTAKSGSPLLRFPKGVVPMADPASILDVLKQGEGRVIFTSCRGEESSWIRSDQSMSVYTYHLIEALQGAGSHPGATEVTVFDLANYLSQAVPATAAAMGHRQTPRVEMRDTERFAIALLHGGKGLLSRGWDTAQATIPTSQTTAAIGDETIAVTGNITGSTIITGNRPSTHHTKVIQKGENNFNFGGTTSHFSIGDTIHLGTSNTQPTKAPSDQGSTLTGSKPSNPASDQQNVATSNDAETPEVLISYAWGGRSEEIANQLEQAFQGTSITLIRDKTHLGFKGRIQSFMEQIGRGKCVVVVISEKYLKSENCMFELVQIAKNQQFYERIFPIVLEDAKIYKPIDRLEYVQYWEEEIRKLDEKLKTVSAAYLDGFREDIDLYNEIRRYLPRLTDILKDMNTLTAKIHSDSGFADLIAAIQQKLEES